MRKRYANPKSTSGLEGSVLCKGKVTYASSTHAKQFTSIHSKKTTKKEEVCMFSLRHCGRELCALDVKHRHLPT